MFPSVCFQTLGASAYHYSKWGWQAWPGMDLSHKLSAKHQLYGSVGKAFRVPTYGELYYHDPNNQGNFRLRAESAWFYAIGDHSR